MLDCFVLAALEWDDALYWLKYHQGAKTDRQVQIRRFTQEVSEQKGKFLAYREAVLEKMKGMRNES